MTQPIGLSLRVSFLSFIAACVFAGCTRGPRQEPTLESFVEHTIDISGHQLIVSLPASGTVLEEASRLNLNVDIAREGGSIIADKHWVWESGTGSITALWLLVGVYDLTLAIPEEGDTFASLVTRQRRLACALPPPPNCGFPVPCSPVRIKDAVRFEPSEVSWLRHDYARAGSHYSKYLDGSEDFLFPLDNKHVLFFTFSPLVGTDTGEGEDQEGADGGTYFRMEIIADEIMKSVSIKRSGEDPSIPYGVPDHGDATGKIRYSDEFSRRVEFNDIQPALDYLRP